jgi:hypothetical protein
MNRDYLRYQEGMLTRREFIKTIITNEDSIFDGEIGCVKKTYQSLANQMTIEYIDPE